MCVLLLFLGVLFLTGCQKNEELQFAEEGSAIPFRKLGDPRDPAEFMSPEEIKMVQDAFNNMEGKKIDNPVVKLNSLSTKGSGEIWEKDVYLLQDIAPTVKVDGDDVFYIKAKILFYDLTLTYDSKVNYCLGSAKGPFIDFYESKNNTNTYIAGNAITGFKRIVIGDCHFKIDVKKTPGFNAASVYVPFSMEWDQRVGYEEGCDLVVRTDAVRVSYYNK